MQNHIAKQSPRHFGWMLVALLALAGQARAATYVGEWDPAFGPAFPNLGWRGEATFFVPDACVDRSTVSILTNSGGCVGSQMEITGAFVEFYDLRDPNETTLETLTFAQPGTVLVMNLEDGLPTHVWGGFTYFLPSNLPIAGSPYSDFLLFFQGDIARMKYVVDPPGPWNSRFGLSVEQANDGSPFLRFRTLEVPEPSSIALLLTALALLGTLARRKLPIA